MFRLLNQKLWVIKQRHEARPFEIAEDFNSATVTPRKKTQLSSGPYYRLTHRPTLIDFWNVRVLCTNPSVLERFFPTSCFPRHGASKHIPTRCLWKVKFKIWVQVKAFEAFDIWHLTLGFEESLIKTCTSRANGNFTWRGSDTIGLICWDGSDVCTICWQWGSHLIWPQVTKLKLYRIWSSITSSLVLPKSELSKEKDKKQGTVKIWQNYFGLFLVKVLFWQH